jgi:hypothetical protein
LEALSSQQTEPQQKNRRDPKRERLTPLDYSKAGILKTYDWSVKERENHDKEMEKYREYLMKLCSLSHKSPEVTGEET